MKDATHGVIGNALYGLYQLQDQDVIPCIFKLAADDEPDVRAASIWTMGKSADPRFLPLLEKLSSDLYASVRNKAARAIAQIQQAEEATAAAPFLDVTVLRAEKLSNGRRSLWIRIDGPDGRFRAGIPRMNFILSEEQDLVVDYQIVERHLPDRLGVGFALCAGSEISTEALHAAEEAVASCLQYRRVTDFWAILKLVPTEGAVEFAWHNAKLTTETAEPTVQPPRYTINRDALKQAIASEPRYTRSRPASLEAVKMLLTGAAAVRGQRHLIVLAGADIAAASDLNLVAKAAIANRVSIHAVMPGAPQPALETFCRKTGGMAVPAPLAGNLEQAYKQIYLGLIDRYEITYRSQAKVANAEPPGPRSVRIRIFSPGGRGDCEIQLA